MGTIAFPDSTIKKSHAGPVSIRDLVVGPVAIDRITLSGFKGNFQYQSGTMKNLRIRMHIHTYADWWINVSVDLGWPIGTITIVDDSGRVDLGTIDTGWSGLGDMAISPGEMNLLVKKASFGPFKLTPAPAAGTKVRSVDVNAIEMVNTRVPDVLPSLFGADIEIPNSMKPVDVTVQETRMATFSTAGIAVPPMSFSNVQALNIEMDQVQSGELNATTTSGEIEVGGFSLAGFAGVDIKVVIGTEMAADSLIFDNLTGNVTTDSVTTTGFTMNMDMNGIIMCYLSLTEYSMPTIEIEG